MQAVLTGTHMHCSSHTVHGHAKCGKHSGKGCSTATPASFRQAAELYKPIITALFFLLPCLSGAALWLSQMTMWSFSTWTCR